METLYGLKRKTTNRWLKLLLLLFVAVGFGVPNLNAQTKSIKVANNQQLIEAIGNTSVGVIELEAGYYQYLNAYIESGTKVIKQVKDGGNRDLTCQYIIEGNNVCYDTVGTDSAFVVSHAFANFSDVGGCGCCPTGPNLGLWTLVYQEPGSTFHWLDPLNSQNMDWSADKPGKYILRYTWAAYFSHVETDYYIWGPATVNLSAPDVCGTSTWVDFTLDTEYPDPDTHVYWTLNGDTIQGPNTTSLFLLEVDPCGLYELCVSVIPSRCPPVTKCITIDFACQPIADAGLDVNVCDALCYYSLFGSYGGVLLSPTHAWSWVQLDGPGTLVFNAQTALETGVCAEDPECAYGEYAVEFQVQNGECYDSDTVLIRFYEQPTANAGVDSAFCNILSFNLWATPYVYCGAPDENYWSSHYWTTVPCQTNPVDGFVIPAGDGVVSFSDPTSPTTTVTITGGECPWGEYTFYWVEKNSKGPLLGGCEACDDVVVTIYEQPIADAGPDVHECVNIAYTPYCYTMYATMEYCYSMNGEWTKSCGPGDVTFGSIYNPTTQVCFPAPGRYQFIWTLSNDMCEDAATVLFDLLETPVALPEFSEDIAACGDLCYSLADIGITKYLYTGVDGVLNPAVECPNYWDMAHWFYVSGPGSDVTFAPDATNVNAELCVTIYGGYTVGWVELNQPPDKDYYCSDTALVYVEFYETPVPDAGDDTVFCGNCYTLVGIPYEYQPSSIPLDDEYWWTDEYGVGISDTSQASVEVCIVQGVYGTYKYYFWERNGECVGVDSVIITFNEMPVPIPLCYVNANDCVPFDLYNPFPIGNRELAFGCLIPNDTIYVCADDCTNFNVFGCQDCGPGFNWENPLYYGWTFEWTVTAPTGTTVQSVPGYYDFDEGRWIYPTLDICWGECCDYARIYLTITTPDCELTIVYYVYVAHKPCVNIVGPDVSDVGTITEYCNVCPDAIDSCLLYNWTAEHCGIITEGQGTECIDVLWTDYNVNGGWGEITLTVFDICTGCCNYDEMPVKIYPTGTVGTDTLAGQVFYDHRDRTIPNAEVDIPLNDVHITLWNGAIATFETDSYVKFVEIDSANSYSIIGYYEFPNINGASTFGLTATYDAPWIPANATDALAVQLKVIDLFPQPFFPLVGEAMDVNNSTTISSTDALWIKQRAIGMVTYFPAGDWVFTPDMLVVPNDGPYDIYALNAGDANRDNYPNSTKAAPAIDLVTDGTMNVVTGKVFELPIRIKDASQFGAITLDLGYDPALIEVVDVVPVDGMISNITDGNVSIAYSNLNPMILAENDVVVTLKVKAISAFTSTESLFTIGLNSEFADGAAEVVEPVTLKSFGVTTAPAATDYFLSANRPNPFSTSTFIEYTMPESGKVKLSVLDMLGQEIAVLVNATQGAGSYTVEFSAAGLATGVYIYKITVDGETRDFISTQRMVISQ